MPIRYLSLAEVLNLYERVIALGGGALGIRDLGALESAVAQPRATFGGNDLYSTLAEKAAALGYSLILNHWRCGVHQFVPSRKTKPRVARNLRM